MPKPKNNRKKTITRYSIVAAIAMTLLPISVNAQVVKEDNTFAIDLFEPAPGPNNFFAVESPQIGDDMKPSVGLMLSYQHKPLVILACDNNDNCGKDVIISKRENKPINIVENLLVSDILASFNFLKRFQVGLALPLIIVQKGDRFEVVNDGFGNNTTQWLSTQGMGTYVSGGVIGDVRLHLKARILGKEKDDGFALSATIIPTFPISAWTGMGDGYSGSGFMTVTAPRVIAGYQIGSLRAAANIAVLWREKSELYSAQTGHSITYGGAVAYSIIPEIEVIAEIYGQKSLITDNFTDMDGAPLLFLGGGRFYFKDFAFNIASGGGIIGGIGVPQFQIIAGATWTPTEKEEKLGFKVSQWDLDGDGIDNEADECPNQAEDLDSFQDEDGCPDNDNDNDGIQDGYDSCPLEPEDKDNFRDDDGCPDLDHDEDGIKEPNDKCPNKAEDYDEFEDEDGCPEDDNDNDGKKDGDDSCPNLAEDMDGFEDNDGCPELDNDNDGVPDATDKCPNKPETLNGLKDEDGCPDKGDPLVVVTEAKIEIKKKIMFTKNSATIRGSKSFEILKIIAGILSGNTTVRVSIEGHTDNRGKANRNRKLSKQRAEAVKAYLVNKKIAADRLETVGWGPDAPIASNKGKRGRSKNRRVEFIIIRPKKTEASTDQANAETSGNEMDFTTGDEGDEMDFTIEEQKDDEVDAPSEDGDEMDFTVEQE